MNWWGKFGKRKNKDLFWKKSSNGGKTVFQISSRWVVFLSLLLGLILVQLYSGETSLKILNLKVGEISSEDIVAEFEFAVPRNPEDIERDKEKTLATVYPIFDFNEDITQNQKKAIKDFFGGIGKGIKGFFGGIWKGIKGLFGDVIITKHGEIIRTAPEDYIIATKAPERMFRGREQVVQNKEVHVHLTIPGILDDATIRRIANAIRVEVERAI